MHATGPGGASTTAAALVADALARAPGPSGGRPDMAEAVLAGAPLRQRLFELAAGLLAEGVVPGEDRLVVLAEPRLDVLLVVHGALLAGVEAVLIAPEARIETIAATLARVRPALAAAASPGSHTALQAAIATLPLEERPQVVTGTWSRVAARGTLPVGVLAARGVVWTASHPDAVPDAARAAPGERTALVAVDPAGATAARATQAELADAALRLAAARLLRRADVLLVERSLVALAVHQAVIAAILAGAAVGAAAAVDLPGGAAQDADATVILGDETAPARWLAAIAPRLERARIGTAVGRRVAARQAEGAPPGAVLELLERATAHSRARARGRGARLLRLALAPDADPAAAAELAVAGFHVLPGRLDRPEGLLVRLAHPDDAPGDPDLPLPPAAPDAVAGHAPRPAPAARTGADGA